MQNWIEPTAITILGNRPSRLARLQRDLDFGKVPDNRKADAEAWVKEAQASVGALAKAIEARKKSPEFQIKIHRIGTPEEPWLIDLMRAGMNASLHETQKRIRLDLAKEFGTVDKVTEDAVWLAMSRDPVRMKEVLTEARDLIVAAADAATYADLFNRGGPAMVLDAATSILDAHTLGDDLGEG